MSNDKKLMNDEELDKVSGGFKNPMQIDDVLGLDQVEALNTKVDDVLNSNSSVDKLQTKVGDNLRCVYCGGVMQSKSVGTLSAGIRVCKSCGATYNPSNSNPWKPGRNTL